jgi:hypothetical protein
MTNQIFTSEDLSLFTAVVDRVCDDLRIFDKTMRLALGRKVLTKAQTGERRFEALVEYAGQTIGNISPYRFSMIDPAGDQRAHHGGQL